MFKRILVPLDGEVRAERALPVAAHLARASGGSLVLFQVVSNPINTGTFMYESAVFTQEDIDAEMAQATRYLKAVSLSDEIEGIGCHMVAEVGPTAPSILSAIDMNDCDLVVMSSHGETGLKRWMMGSIAQKIVRHSPVPVLVLRDGGPMLSQVANPPRALVSLDGSPMAESAIMPAAQLIAALAGKEQGTLHLVHVVAMPVSKADADLRTVVARREEAHTYMSTLAERLLKVDLVQFNLHITSSIVFEPDVAATLVHMAEQGDTARNIAGCDIIAMATHGRSGPQRWALGSITERALSATKLPLLIVRPHEAGGRHSLPRKEVHSTV